MRSVLKQECEGEKSISRQEETMSKTAGLEKERNYKDNHLTYLSLITIVLITVLWLISTAL